MLARRSRSAPRTSKFVSVFVEASAADAKTNFGALLDKAQREPVTISKNGRPVAVVMSATAYEEQQRLKLDLLRQEVTRGLEDLKRRKLVAAKEAFTQLDRELKD